MISSIDFSSKKATITGCVAKVSDAALNIGNDAFEDLGLDYKDTEFKKISENNEEIYVMGCTCDCCLTNEDYPHVSEDEQWNTPPCTGTGIIGGDRYLIPEYTCGSGKNISDGVIYKVDRDGNEYMAALWDEDKNRFVLME